MKGGIRLVAIAPLFSDCARIRKVTIEDVDALLPEVELCMNEAFGYDLIVQNPKVMLVNIVVHEFDIPHAEGVTFTIPKLGSEISISPEIDTELAVVLMHEMGHALGLEHVKDKGNIMYKEAFGYHGPTTPETIAPQLAALCKQYGCETQISFKTVKK